MLTKNADLNKYRYSGHSIRFDSPSQLSLPDGSWGKNVITFGVDNSHSIDIDNIKKNIPIFGEGPTQGIDDTKITAEYEYPINFTEWGKRFVLNLQCNKSITMEATVSYLLMLQKKYQFEAKYSEMKPYILCFGNVSKDLTINNRKKTGLNGRIKV